MRLILKIVFCVYCLCSVLFNSQVYAQSIYTDLDITFETFLPREISRPFVNAKIQGQSIKLLFDTGFEPAPIALKKELLDVLSVEHLDEKQCARDAFGHKKCSNLFLIKELILGDLVLKNVRGIVLDDDNIFSNDDDPTKLGLIGLPLISEFNVLLNYPNNKIILSRAPIQDDESLVEQSRLKFSLNGTIQTDLIIDGSVHKLLWDTGAFSILSGQLINKMNQENCPVLLDENIKCLDTTYQKDFIYPLQPTWFYLIPFSTELNVDGFVGSQYFHRYPVKMDFNKKELVFYHPTWRAQKSGSLSIGSINALFPNLQKYRD